MDFFIPSLLAIILAAIIVFAFLPRFAPIILLVLSAGLLTFGVYNHYSLFQQEYRYSTWQDGLKEYGPAVVIGAIVLFLIGFIMSFFGGVSVPVPEMPSMPAMPAMPELPEMPNVPAVLNNVVNTAVNAMNTVKNAVMPGPGANAEIVASVPQNQRNRNAAAAPALKRNNIRPSFFEEI
jgi:predicted PurR-regulated permease PerM